MSGEIWKPVVGYEGLYEVSDQGRVRNRKGTIRKPHYDAAKRASISIWRNNQPKTFRVHNMVAEAFLGQRPYGLQVLHGDGDPTNNRLTNLRYGSGSENMQDAIAHGTFLRGARSPCALLTDADVEIIRAFPKARGYQNVLAQRFGVTQATISLVIRNKTYKFKSEAPCL